MDQTAGSSREPSRKLKVARQLRVNIYDGTYPAGAQLPSVRDLMHEYSVSNTTAQDVLRLLKGWGLAESRGPDGTFVAELHDVVHPRERLSRMAAGFSPLSPGETSRITHAGWHEDVPQRVRQALDADADSRISRREGVVLRGERVVEVTIVWHSQRAADAAPELREAVPIREGGTVGALKRAGIVIAASASEYAITAHNADRLEAALLGCQAGAALLTISHTRLDADGTPVEHLEMCYPPDVALRELPSA